jgi:hypothetical protein
MARFTDETEMRLRRVGWYPGRQVPKLVASWKKNEMLSEFEMFPSAEKVLLEFGGLIVREQGPGETCARVPFDVDPVQAGYEESMFRDYSGMVNTKLYPLGEVANGLGYWAIGENDHIYMLVHTIQLLGQNIDEALDNLILGRQAKDILTE